ELKRLRPRQPLSPMKDQDLELHRGAADDAGGRVPGCAGDKLRKRQLAFGGPAHDFGRGVRSRDRRYELGIATGFGELFGQPRTVNLASPAVQIKQALSELHHLGETARDG